MLKAFQESKKEKIKNTVTTETADMADSQLIPRRVTSEDEDLVIDRENQAAPDSKTQQNGTAAKVTPTDDGVPETSDEVRSGGNLDAAAKEANVSEEQFDEQQKSAAAALKQQAQNEAEAAKYLAAARMANNPLHMMAQGARMGLTGAVPPMVWPSNAAAAAAYSQASFVANHGSPASASAAAGMAAAAAAAQSSQSTGPQTLLYTVGFGIDPRQSVSNGWDATEAAVRALRDAMERSTVRLPPSGQGNPFQIHVKIGVPPRQDIISRLEPMNVDMSRITSILPRSIPVMPIDIVVGGLSVSGHDDPDVSICSAVACVTVQTNANTNPINQERHAWERASVAANPGGLHPMMNQMSHAPIEGNPAWSSNLERQQQQQKSQPQEDRRKYNRTDSMEMLARISEQVRERQSLLGGRLRPQDGSAEGSMTSQGIYDDPQKQQQSVGSNKDDDDTSSNTEDRDNYKKLPPGVTAKNNKRQFVQHNYHDHSLELPTAMEENPMFTSVAKSGKSGGSQPSFPVKLHELLSEIEADGYGFILSWLPHGRSFKIHKQQEFLDVILPQYFVMTKKSSFLRQLNLYGFNRFSAGPDKGSYYHELFLRGMPWLSKRMTRMKVNGNGIRAAGNPDMEPDFYTMPPVPREELATAGHREIYVRTPYNMDDQPQVSKQEQTTAVPQQMQQEEVQAPSPLPEPQSQKDLSNISPKILNGTTQISFPLKLQTMLDKLEAEGDTDAISWLPHGRGFLVHKPDIFVSELMPAYFRQTKYSSFQRQLHMYSFQRITAGRDKGAYYHEHFLRGKPRLCQKMVRTRINGKGCRKPGNPSNEPDFYSMKPMAIVPEGTNIEIPKDLISSPGGPDDDDASSS
mmetsp:Transcript_8154/g.11746  ORF Transcript_8154/g.11746 Transcript_8154/m.11746 type:complete len:859 (-) Transcript_8154:1336-3912(-)